MSQNWSQEKSAAVAAVREAAKVCRRVQQQLVSEQTLVKKDKSPVTVADFASQAVVCDRLARAFPKDAVVGEEGTGDLREPGQAALLKAVVENAGVGWGRAVNADEVLAAIDRGGAGTGKEERYWTLDPIDGTKGFLRKEQYAVALALIERGQVVLGVLGCPNLNPDGGPDGYAGGGLLVVAVRGQGAQVLSLEGDALVGKPAHVDAIADPRGARFCESVESGHSDQDLSAKIVAALGARAEPIRMDSQAKYAVVGQGQASIYLRLPTRADYRECIWDHAAGMIVVEEAGGRVTDVDGKPLAYAHGRKLDGNRGIIATSGLIHDAVVKAVGAALG
ncbi:MAG: 3'(2'),5'-bisphosphate nucleotidase [Planctomycetota bacterium]|nr:3'(2'),5'-bisphosphate nucleotidase [Planctomycetota bacterium]